MEPIQVTVDTQKNSFGNEIRVTQNDTAIKFVIKIQQNGKDIPLTPGSIFTLTNLRVDNVAIVTPNLGEITGPNSVTFTLGTRELEVLGIVRASVQILNQNGRISSLSFNYIVVNDLSEFPPSGSDKTLIEKVLGEGPTVIEDAKRSSQRAEEAALSIDQSIVAVVEVVKSGNELFEEVEMLKGSTEKVKEETELVKSETLTVKQTAEKTIEDTLAAKLATEQVKRETEVVKQATENLRTGMQGELNTVKTQLADTSKEMDAPRTLKSEKIRPVITFLDDDTVKEVYTRLKPIFDARNVKGSLAAITGQIGQSYRLSLAQLKQMYNEGWEILGHTVNHNNLSQYTDDEETLEKEIGGCKAWLESNGIIAKGFVYPQNYSDEKVRRIAKKHFKYSFGSLGINGDLVDTPNISRIAFGSFTTQNPTINGNSEKNTLAYYKACVDYAKANNQWLVFMTHIVSQDVSEDAVLGELIDYIKNQNIEILNTSEAYEIHGNRLFSGDVSSQYFLLDKNGVPKTPMSIKKGKSDGVLTTDTIKSFEFDKTTINIISVAYASANGFPLNEAGTLFTHYINKEIHRYNYQEYYTIGGNRFIRFCLNDSGTSWGEWSNDMPYRLFPKNTYSGTTLLQNFKKGISVFEVDDTNVAGTPNGKAGIFHTYFSDVPGNDHQTFKEKGTNDVYMRTTYSTRTFGEWQRANLLSVDPYVAFTAKPSAIKLGVHVRYVSSSDSDRNNFPEPTLFGVLVTYKASADNLGTYQEYHPKGSTRVYKRAWDEVADKWSLFNLITPAAFTTGARPPRPSKGMSYFDETLGKPVWCKTEAVLGTNNSIITGAVWVDATGATVIG